MAKYLNLVEYIYYKYVYQRSTHSNQQEELYQIFGTNKCIIVFFLDKAYIGYGRTFTKIYGDIK